MENAAKALLIAAGIFFAMLILSLSIWGIQNITNYYEAKERSQETEQLAKFNKQYSNYNRDNVRGSDLLSLVNKIIDYNKANEDDPAIQPIEIDISLEGSNNQDFYYKYETYATIKLFNLATIYTEENLPAVLSQVNQYETKYPRGMANTLANKISTLTGDNSSQTRAQLLEELKINYTVNNNEILKYYQYVQFKRAHFDCEKLTYTDDGRVEKFTFKFNGKFE